MDEASDVEFQSLRRFLYRHMAKNSLRHRNGVFIPLTTLTMSGIRKEDMVNASAIYNLLRNLGGSFGVAFVTTMLSRRAQYHQTHLVEHLTPFDPAYNTTSEQISRFLQYKGFENTLSEQGGLGMIYRELLRQASMLSFNDTFTLLYITT